MVGTWCLGIVKEKTTTSPTLLKTKIRLDYKIVVWNLGFARGTLYCNVVGRVEIASVELGQFTILYCYSQWRAAAQGEYFELPDPTTLLVSKEK